MAVAGRPAAQFIRIRAGSGKLKRLTENAKITPRARVARQRPLNCSAASRWEGPKGLGEARKKKGSRRWLPSITRLCLVQWMLNR